MDLRTKHHTFSRLLLAVFLPMLLLSAVHIHPSAASSYDSCVECVNHTPHAGHWSLNVSHPDDCVLCQFTTLLFVAGVTVFAVLLRLASEPVCERPQQRCVLRSRATRLRGPPAY